MRSPDAQTRERADLSLEEMLRLEYREIYLVHRLDQPVSGIVLFARTHAAAAKFSELFATGAIRKTYLAAINGAIIFFLPLILVGIGWYAGMDRRTLGMTAGIAGLVIVQSLLLFPYHTDVQGPLRAISGFHALNALLIFWLALRLMDRVRYPRTASQVPPVSTS